MVRASMDQAEYETQEMDCGVRRELDWEYAARRCCDLQVDGWLGHTCPARRDESHGEEVKQVEVDGRSSQEGKQLSQFTNCIQAGDKVSEGCFQSEA